MYSFASPVFGTCRVQCRKQNQNGTDKLRIVEIQTIHRFAPVVSLYRYDVTSHRNPGRCNTQENDRNLCRFAVAQFLRSNTCMHIARVEALDIASPKFSGELKVSS